MSSRHIKRFHEGEIILPTRRVGLSGHFRLEAFQCWELANGRSVEIPGSRRLVAEFDNLITNLGLDYIGDGTAYADYCQVGEGNAAEANTDTTLDDYVAGVARVTAADTWAARGSPPYYGWSQRKYRFEPNFAGGAVNIAEIGIAKQAGTGGLFSRALVRDGGGSPTTAAVSATEYFDVFYTLRNYPDHVNYDTGATDDGEGTVVIAGTSYDYTIRAADLSNQAYWGRTILYRGFNSATNPGTFHHIRVYGTDVALGAVTGLPSATLSEFLQSGVTMTLGTYSPSTYTNTLTYGLGLSQGNLSGGIQGMVVNSSLGSYQMVLDGAIPKTGSVELNYVHRTTWFRKSLL